MKMIDLLEIIQDENRSEDFLRSRGILKTFTHCVKCESTKLGMIRGDRWKCYSCKAEWTRRKDSILSLVRMKYSEFILCMKFFELELTAEECSAQSKINIKAINLLYLEFRKCLSGFDSATLSDFRNLMKKNVGNIILNIQGRRIQTEFATSMNRTSDPAISIYRSRTGNSSTALKFKFAKLNRNINLIGDKNFSLLGIFWRYSKPRLTRFNGTRLLTFILYLKELEFRFNNIGKNIFDLVLLEISKNFKGG